MIKLITKYIGIGLLIGIGFSITDYIYFQAVKEEKNQLISSFNQQMKDIQELFLELEAFSGNGNIISECQFSTKDIKPGAWEMIIKECPLLKSYIGRPVNKITFKFKKAFHSKTHIKNNK